MCKKLAKNARIFGIWDKAQMGEGVPPPSSQQLTNLLCQSIIPFQFGENTQYLSNIVYVLHCETYLSMLTATRLMTEAKAVSILIYSFSLQTAPPFTSWVKWSLVTSSGMQTTSISSSAKERLARNIPVLMLCRLVWVVWRQKSKLVCPMTPTRKQ